MRFLKKVNQLHNISCSSVLEAHTAILRCQCEVARMNMYIACKTEQAACLQSRMFNLISSIDWHIAVVKLSIKYLYDINYWHEYAQFAFSLTWLSTSVWAHSHPVHSTFSAYTHQMNGHLVGTVFATHDKQKTVQLYRMNYCDHVYVWASNSLFLDHFVDHIFSPHHAPWMYIRSCSFFTFKVSAAR